MKKFICVFLITTFVATILTFHSNAQTIDTTNQPQETKVYCNATLDDTFADDCVTVVINKNNSKLNKAFEKSKFKRTCAAVSCR